MKTIILASQSMFRKEMMEQAQIPFEVISSDADETPTEGLSFEEQLAEISMRKAQTVLEMTKDRGRRIIVAADQNIIFDGVSYGKPKTVEDAKFLIVKMMGRDVYSYTGNTVIYADGEKIIDCINNCDIARMHMEYATDETIEKYLAEGRPLTKCGGINVKDTPFLHLVTGRLSTAMGMTIEYLQDMITKVGD